MASVSKRPRRKADGSNGDKWIVRYLDGDSHKQRSFDKKRGLLPVPWTPS